MTARPGGSNNNNQNRPSTAPADERSLAKEQQRETFRIIKEMSDILNTGLDTHGLGYCLRLCEEGVNPVALAQFIKDWRQHQVHPNHP